MKTARYMTVLAEYVRRFKSSPPSILADRAALELMEAALRRGTPISAADMTPSGPAESGED